jgi:threonyl-tRNA synthetase
MHAPSPSTPLQLSPEEAEARIKAINEPYKLEILESIRARDPTAPITIYHIGETDHPAHWWDLCAGPHVESTGSIKADAFELETVAGAYWRGDEKNAMLQVRCSKQAAQEYKARSTSSSSGSGGSSRSWWQRLQQQLR